MSLKDARSLLALPFVGLILSRRTGHRGHGFSPPTYTDIGWSALHSM